MDRSCTCNISFLSDRDCEASHGEKVASARAEFPFVATEMAKRALREKVAGIRVRFPFVATGIMKAVHGKRWQVHVQDFLL